MLKCFTVEESGEHQMDYYFEKGKFTEAELEQAIIELFTAQGYAYVHGENIHRQYEDILLLDDLHSFLTARYAAESLSEVEIQKIINKLNLINATPLYIGNRDTFWLVNEGFDLIRDDSSKVALHVDYIDFDHPFRGNTCAVLIFWCSSMVSQLPSASSRLLLRRIPPSTMRGSRSRFDIAATSPS